jgi:hypothetical protein
MIRPAGGKSYAMLTLLWLPPLVRALATALIVVSASALAEALGPFWGALIATLPVSAGPAYVFLAMRQREDFVAASALSSCAANAATGVFLVVYGRLARRSSAWRSLGVAVLAWFAGSLATRQIDWTPATAAGLNLLVYGAGFALLSTAGEAALKPRPPTPRRWFELPVRAVAVASFVSLLVSVSTLLCPAATGIAAVFPVSLISLIVIVGPRIGGPASALLAANALRAMLGFGAMLLVLHLAIRPWGTATALLLALAVSLAWSAALLGLRGRRHAGSTRAPGADDRARIRHPAR